MRFRRQQVKPQLQLMMSKLIREGHIEVLSSGRAGIEYRLERLISRYIDDYEAIEDKTYKFLGENDMDTEAFYKRVLRNFAKQDEVPLDSDALDMLHEQIESQLWDEDDVEELYVEGRELVALVNPFLKAMK